MTAPLAVGQIRRCKVKGASLFDLEAYPVDEFRVLATSSDT